jgi:hypothetical protein
MFVLPKLAVHVIWQRCYESLPAPIGVLINNVAACSDADVGSGCPATLARCEACSRNSQRHTQHTRHAIVQGLLCHVGQQHQLMVSCDVAS